MTALVLAVLLVAVPALVLLAALYFALADRVGRLEASVATLTGGGWDENELPRAGIAGSRAPAREASVDELTASTEALAELELAAPVQDVDVERRVIRGVVIPAGNLVASTSAGPTRFEPGSLTWSEPRRVKLLREHQRTDALGYATELTWTDAGLLATFHVPEGPSGDRALADAKNGLRDGLSVGAEQLTATRDRGGVLVVTAGRLREVSLVSVPAYDDARVTSVAATAPATTTERNPMTCQTCGRVHAPGAPCSPAPAPTPPAPAPAGVTASSLEGLTAAQLVEQVITALREGNVTPVAPAPVGGTTAPHTAPAPTGPRELNLESFVELMASNYRGESVDVREVRAALADVTPANTGPDGGGAFRPVYLAELWDGAEYQRKFIENAVTVRPLPRGLKVIGQRWVTRPVFDDYAGNKAAVPSNQPVLTDIEVSVYRGAGAHDVDRAYIDQGDPAWLSSYFEAQTESYKRWSDAKVASIIHAAATALVDDDATPGTFPTLLEGVVAAVVELAGLGESVNYVAMAPGLVAELLGVTNMEAPAFFQGAFSLGNQGDGGLGGLTWFTSPGLPAGEFQVGSKASNRHHEKTPPIRVQAVDVANGGIDLGVFGYAATYLRNPNGVRKGAVGA